jgi:hypothetical protein
MNTNADSSASTSDTTSANAPPRSAGEAAFLKQQADDTQAALKKALEDLKASLAQGVDVRLWAKEHPLATAAVAAVAGFAAAGAAIPSKRQQELKRWIAIERAANAVDGHGNGNPKPPPPRPQPGFMATLGKEAIAILRPALIGLVTSAVAAHQDEDENQKDDDNPQDEVIL